MSPQTKVSNRRRKGGNNILDEITLEIQRVFAGRSGQTLYVQLRMCNLLADIRQKQVEPT